MAIQKFNTNVFLQPCYYRFFLRKKNHLEIDLNIAMMCSERKPEDCHRSRLIGRVLFENGIEIRHIDENGEIKDQPTVMNTPGTLPF